MKKAMLAGIGAVLALSVAVGCSSDEQIVRRETHTVVRPAPPTVVEERPVTQDPTVEERTTVIKRKTTDSD